MHSKYKLTRRSFLWLIGCVTGSTTLPSISGCSATPSLPEQLVLLNQEQDIAVDRKYARHQFSHDMGVVLNEGINSYLSDVGSLLANIGTNRQLPFTFQAVNANYANSYAFPGGSIALSRGLLLALHTEDELAACLGNEIAHVHLRHWAKGKTKEYVFTVLTLGFNQILSVVIPATDNSDDLLLPKIDPQALLTKYTEEQEIQADSLSLEYANVANYNPQGMVDFLATISNASSEKGQAFAVMQATHPITNNRVRIVQRTVQGTYKQALALKLKYEKYMDSIASIRAIAPSITLQQQAEVLIAQAQFDQAQQQIDQALTLTPKDYPALIHACRLALLQEYYPSAKTFADQAIEVNPQEALGYNLQAVINIAAGNPQQAIESLTTYNSLLPGNAHIEFLRAYSYDKMDQGENATTHYQNYLQMVFTGQQAEYARQRIVAIDA